MTNSTTSEGWLHKTNFSKLKEDPIQATVRLEVARMHATHYITHSIKEYSQGFPGEANFVADSLSPDDNRMDSKLTNLFCMHCLSQIPELFLIQPLPNKITSWLTALLLRLPMKLQLQEKHTRTKIGRGHDGQPTAAGWTLGPIPWQLHMPRTNQTPLGLRHGYAGSPFFKIISCQTG